MAAVRVTARATQNTGRTWLLERFVRAVLVQRVGCGAIRWKLLGAQVAIEVRVADVARESRARRIIAARLHAFRWSGVAWVVVVVRVRRIHNSCPIGAPVVAVSSTAAITWVPRPIEALWACGRGSAAFTRAGQVAESAAGRCQAQLCVPPSLYPWGADPSRVNAHAATHNGHVWGAAQPRPTRPRHSTRDARCGTWRRHGWNPHPNHPQGAPGFLNVLYVLYLFKESCAEPSAGNCLVHK